jgi:hypothetical protein
MQRPAPSCCGYAWVWPAPRRQRPARPAGGRSLDGGLLDLCIILVVGTLVIERLGDDLRAVARRATLLVLPGRVGHAALHADLAALPQ